MQSSVLFYQAVGVIGEFFDDSPRRVRPAIIVSADAANNVIGRAFTVTNLGSADGTSQTVVTAGGTGTFAGIFVGPKELATSGTAAGGSLAPTLTVPNNTTGEFATMGSIIINLPSAGADTSALKYNNTTGVIDVGAPGAGETALPNAKIVRFLNSAASLAVVQLTN